jgi:hypothetical protein
VLKSVQFHGFVRFVGGAGSPRDHVRAFLYGEGVDRFMPFNLGTVAVASALEDQGVPQRQAGQAAALRHLFALFEIVALGIVALVMVGWTTFFGQLFWGVFILAMAYLIVRSRRRPGREPGEGSMLGWLRDALGALAQRPVVFARLLVLSVISFALLPLAAYVISQAFTSTNVILNVDIGILVAAVVAGQIARLIPVTPGGIGQFEWGFAAAVYVAEVGIPEAITVAFLFGFFRYVVDMIVVGKYLWGRVGERPLTLAAETQAGFSRLAPATGSSPPRES